MSDIVEKLVEMGFSKEKAELAVSRSNYNEISSVMDWILSHDEELDAELLRQKSTESTPNQDQIDNQKDEKSTVEQDEQQEQQSESSTSQENQVVRSIKCEDCGKLFKDQTEVEFHASKSGHENFSESTEEKKPLTEEEKREQLAKIEAKLKQRRLEREKREEQEALEKERNRIRSGKEMLEAKKKLEELEMKKIIEQRKREKEEERLARQRVREQIEQDKLARKAKFSGAAITEPATITTTTITPQQPSQSTTPKPQQSYTEVVLQIRLTNGSCLVQSFGAKEPLSAVRLYVEMNRKDGDGPFSLMTSFPRKIFGPEDYDVPLESLGLAPRATLIVTKT